MLARRLLATSTLRSITSNVIAPQSARTLKVTAQKSLWPAMISSYPNPSKSYSTKMSNSHEAELFPQAVAQLKILEREFEQSHQDAKKDKDKEPDSHAVVSVFDLFSIGLGPSSSHTVGPMRAAFMFVTELQKKGILSTIKSIRAELYGSLALTGVGHGTPSAVLMGLEGETPRNVETESIEERVLKIQNNGKICLLKGHIVDFDYKKHLIFHMDESLPAHPNGMRFSVFDDKGDLIATNEYYSIGGGFVIDNGTQYRDDNAFFRKSTSAVNPVSDTGRKNVIEAPLPFRTSQDLLDLCHRNKMSIADIVVQNELKWRSKTEVYSGLMDIWRTMDASITNGCWSSKEYLPGPLKVKRRAPLLFKRLMEKSLPITPSQSAANNVVKTSGKRKDFPTLTFLDWLSCFAIAVNEENACGGRVVTAPTNGAAGVIPAVLKYYLSFVSQQNEEDIVIFLTTAAAVGMLFKRGASISAAEVGCQGEVGVACSMAAAGLTAVMGGTPAQVENAAEIGMEHNLGLTCDPIAGLVQIPCIERNALGAAKAVTASQLALSGDGVHRVSLDQVIETMRQTGADMQTKYKETSLGGLALSVPVC